jgi:hypothetical protein
VLSDERNIPFSIEVMKKFKLLPATDTPRGDWSLPG